MFNALVCNFYYSHRENPKVASEKGHPCSRTLGEYLHCGNFMFNLFDPQFASLLGRSRCLIGLALYQGTKRVHAGGSALSCAADKGPGGVHPVCIGETWRHLIAKCLLFVAGSETKEACSINQL
jgi:hypothetical protein